MRRKNHMAPARIILIGFALLILAGALLLTLPISTRDGQGAAFFDALFTATSATCVTGLVVQDTALYWSGFGQAVILMLIQIGGMGVVTAAAAISMLAGRRIGLKERWVMQESISAPQVGGIVRRTRFILAVTLVLEGTGTLLLALRFCPEMGLFRGLWYAVFHAVSSFCNAGFDLMGAAGTPFVSLTGYAGDPLVNFTVMGLIVLGGIGFLTWGDVREHKWHLRAYCLQSKLVLAVTAALILLPALFFLLYELRLPQWQTLTLGEKVQGALFQAVTPRTAGYNTLDLSQLSEPSRLLITLLMLVGGSPGSTAGGFKVTTLAVFVLAARAVFRRVKLLGSQDTLFCAPLPEKEREKDGFLGPRGLAPRKPTAQYYTDCEIAGDIDFIFGGGDALFENCVIRTVDNHIPHSYVTAPSGKADGLGFVFWDCDFVSDCPAGSVYLGRPWRPEGKTAVLDCRLGAHIAPEGFSPWNDRADTNLAAFAEAGSNGPGAVPRPGWVHALRLLGKDQITGGFFYGTCLCGICRPSGSGAAGPCPLPLPPLKPKSPKE